MVVGYFFVMSHKMTGHAAPMRKKNVRERRATGVGIAGKSRVVGPLTLGEKKVMVVHGA